MRSASELPGNEVETTYGITPAQMISQLGLAAVLQPLPTGSLVPNFNISGFQHRGHRFQPRSK